MIIGGVYNFRPYVPYSKQRSTFPLFSAFIGGSVNVVYKPSRNRRMHISDRSVIPDRTVSGGSASSDLIIFK